MHGRIMMRSLVIDFPDDENVADVTDEYMFGPSFLVAPVTHHMYYLPGSRALNDVPKNRSVYLPKGCGWYDFYTQEYYEGGTTVIADAPIEKMPLYVRAGSIIPMALSADHENTKKLTADTIVVYEGADCSFDLYSDSGDGYAYENGEYDLTRLTYSEKDRLIQSSVLTSSNSLTISSEGAAVQSDTMTIATKLITKPGRSE